MLYTKFARARVRAMACAMVALASTAPACGSGPAEPDRGGPSSAQPAAHAGPSLASIQLSLPNRSPADAAARAGAIAQVLTERRVERTSLAPLEESLERAPQGASAHLADAPHVAVGHHARLDAAWAIDEDVAHDVTTATDVGVEAAAAQFRRMVASLDAAGLVEAAGLDVAGAQVSHVIQGSARSGGAPPVERVKEYVFFAPRTIGGMAVVDAGVRVSVHRSGKVASIRIEGPTAMEVREHDGRGDGPSAPGAGAHAIAHATVRVVPEATLDARARIENPDAEIAPLGLVYVMPNGESSAVVAPRQGYMVYPRVEIGGRVGPGRGHRVLYAIDDAEAAPL